MFQRSSYFLSAPRGARMRSRSKAHMWRSFRKWTVRITIIVFIALFGLFIIAELMIGLGARRFIQIAQDRFPGDRITALISMVECESCNMNDRNHAVWTLGQLTDRRALPVLENYYTGDKCDHTNRICQYELEKALKLIRNGHNYEITFWRWMLP